MSKIRFDPNTYHFYVPSGSGQAIRAKAAGFRWDPLRSRYYTPDPSVAKCVADCGDRYVKHLLADLLGSLSSPTSAPEISRQRRDTNNSLGRSRSLRFAA